MSAAADLKVPPHSVDAEQRVLGCLLLAGSPEQTQVALTRIGDLSGDFYRHAHALVFGAVVALTAAHEPVDPVTVNDYLKQTAPEATHVGGIAGIAALMDTVPSAAQVEHYAGIVRSLALVRRVQGAAQHIAGAAYGLDHHDAGDFVAQAVAALQAAAQSADANKPDLVHVGAAVQRVFDNISAATQTGASKRIVPYGIPELDAELGGSLVGLVETFAADVGSGKSTLMLQMALHVARTEPVLCITLEDSVDNWTARALGQVSGVAARALIFQPGTIPVGKWGSLTAAAVELNNTGLWFREGKRPDLDSIRMTLALAKARMPTLRLVVIDYVQRINARSDGFRVGDRVAELRWIIESLERDAEQLGLSIRLVSQLNRAARKDTTRPPHTGDMRDSGALEETAKRCTFLWRPDPNDVASVEVGFGTSKSKMPVDPGLAFFVVAKDGHGGRLGCVPLLWDRHHERYTGLEPVQPVPLFGTTHHDDES